MSSYLNSIRKEFQYYKHLGDKTINQLNDKELCWQYNEESNSIAIIVKHLWGNMLSRWTDFLTADGEKPTRDRESEFENDIKGKQQLLQKWNEGWGCLFNAVNSLTEKDLSTIIYIRNEGHTVTEAINRQVAHYAYHVGQIVFIGKMIKGREWESLSIPRGKSQQFNAHKFSKEKHEGHFTDEIFNHKLTP
jgi:hypothetical protein